MIHISPSGEDYIISALDDHGEEYLVGMLIGPDESKFSYRRWLLCALTRINGVYEVDHLSNSSDDLLLVAQWHWIKKCRAQSDILVKRREKWR